MHPAETAWAALLALLAMLAAPAKADARRMTPCTGPDDPRPCLVEGGEPDRSRLPEAGPAAWVSGDRLVISWVGEADEVRVAGNVQFARPMPRVAPGLFQYVVRYPKAQQTRTQLRFAVKRGGTTEVTRQPTDLVGPDAFALLPGADGQGAPVSFGPSLPKAHVWLPPGYRPGVRYPILYLADGGGTSPGTLLAEPIRRGELAPVIVVGVDDCPEDDDTSACRLRNYSSAASGPLTPAFVAHERFLLDTVIPAIEARYGAPPERRLRAIGGASAGGVWTASMTLRNPGVFGTAFVMSPGTRPAQHGQARPLSRFYVSAGDLEPSFRWAGQCLAGDIVARGGVATFSTPPSGHDTWMWSRILLDNVRDWLAPQPAAPRLAPLPEADCEQRSLLGYNGAPSS